MAHTFSCLHYHVVFSAKQGRNLIPQDCLARLHAYMAGIVRNIEGQAIAIGGTTNHGHSLVSFPPTMAITKAVNAIKSNSSKWAHETFPAMAEFAWQEGYGAFAVSKSNVDVVAEYIRNQALHHRTMSFEDEIFGLLDRHGIQYDRATVLD